MLRTLVVEDDFVSRKILQALLTPFGPCDIAVNGAEAVIAFQLAIQAEEPYHLICMDITMPGMNGNETLVQIRSIEEQMGLKGLDRTRVIMTTGSTDPKDVRSAFRSECDAYLVKPIQKPRLMDQLMELGLFAVMCQ